jgi:hypothetical protein
MNNNENVKTINLEDVNITPENNNNNNNNNSTTSVGENTNSMTDASNDNEEESNMENTDSVEGEIESINITDEEIQSINTNEGIPNNINKELNLHTSLFPDQLTVRKSDIYQNYESTISIFFRKERSSDDFSRVVLNDMYVMIDKKNDNNKTVIIPPLIVNIKKYYVEKEKRKNFIYNDISLLISNLKNESENKNKFDKLKEELKTISTETDDIKQFLEEQKNIINNLNSKRTDAIFNLSKTYFRRTEKYREINSENVNNTKIKKILSLYKESNRHIPSDETLNKEASKLEININNLKKIFEWIDISRKYIETQTEVNLLKKDIEQKMNLFENINNNFILKMPEVKENKDVNIQLPEVKKGGSNQSEIKLVKLN